MKTKHTLGNGTSDSVAQHFSHSVIENHYHDDKNEYFAKTELLNGLMRSGDTAECKAAYKELETFSHMVSHDLQSQLRTICGYSKLLERKFGNTLDEDGKSLLEGINKSAAYTARLVKHLLEFSKLGKSELRKEVIAMHTIVEPVLKEIRIDESFNKYTIKLGHLGNVNCDSPLMQQVWSNLIWNAVKYSAKKTEPIIEIGMKHIEGEDIYYVKDNGVGFDMKDSGEIFNPFYRNSNHSGFEGTGLGLANVHRIITKHGGKIWVDADVDKGACFYFTLPEK